MTSSATEVSGIEVSDNAVETPVQQLDEPVYYDLIPVDNNNDNNANNHIICTAPANDQIRSERDLKAIENVKELCSPSGCDKELSKGISQRLLVFYLYLVQTLHF
jgi:hypothetical protein